MFKYSEYKHFGKFVHLTTTKRNLKVYLAINHHNLNILYTRRMSKNVLIFVPNSLEKSKTGVLEGFSVIKEDCEAYFITNNKILSKCEKCIGFAFESSVYKDFTNKKCVFYNNKTDRVCLNVNSGKSTTIFYDFHKFSNSDVAYSDIGYYGEHFKQLVGELRRRHHKNHGNKRKSFIFILIYVVEAILHIFKYTKKFTEMSATLQHSQDSLHTFSWLLNNLHSEGKLSCKSGNVLVAKIVDLILGGIFLYFFIKHQDFILEYLEITTENIVRNLKELLIYLMGSPIGLKLNHAFNNSLGKFFFYHINMWRIFLQLMHPVIVTYYKYLVLPAAFGLSFQVAMLSDLVSVATFHVYCIYIYAARLFSLQIRALTSLWKLFIGRKYNPLRERVDSCEYSPNQLFIGTLGFAVMLFLLPTTILYYCVFTTFRLIILAFIGILARTKYILDCLPLYVITLWVFRSSCLAGSLSISLENVEKEKADVYVKLEILGLSEVVTKFCPESIKKLENCSLRTIFKDVFTGVLI